MSPLAPRPGGIWRCCLCPPNTASSFAESRCASCEHERCAHCTVRDQKPKPLMPPMPSLEHGREPPEILSQSQIAQQDRVPSERLEEPSLITASLDRIGKQRVGSEEDPSVNISQLVRERHFQNLPHLSRGQKNQLAKAVKQCAQTMQSHPQGSDSYNKALRQWQQITQQYRNAMAREAQRNSQAAAAQRGGDLQTVTARSVAGSNSITTHEDQSFPVYSFADFSIDHEASARTPNLTPKLLENSIMKLATATQNDSLLSDTNKPGRNEPGQQLSDGYTPWLLYHQQQVQVQFPNFTAEQVLKLANERLRVQIRDNTLGMQGMTNYMMMKQNSQHHFPTGFEEPHDWDSSDEDSRAESVFSTDNASMTSTTTMQTSALVDTAIDELANMFIRHNKVGLYCKIALEDEAVGGERFARNFRRLLQIFGVELRLEAAANVPGLIETATILRRHSREITNRIRRLLDNTTQMLDLPQAPENKSLQIEQFLQDLQSDIKDDALDKDDIQDSDDSLESDFEGIDETSQQLPNIAELKMFLFTSTAFEGLLEGLANLIDPSWATKLQALMRRIERNPDRYRTDGKALQKLRSIFADLMDVDPSCIDIQYNDIRTQVERVQSRVEYATNTSWNWWPLHAPRLKLSDTHAYIKWSCNCGDERIEQMSSLVTRKLEKLVHSRHFGVHHDRHRVELVKQNAVSGGDGQNGASLIASGSGSSPSPNRVSVPPPVAQPFTLQSVRRQGATPTRKGYQGNVSAAPGVTKPQKHVFLAVGESAALALAQLRADGLHDDCFFEALRREYISKRGRLRYHLSPWIYKGCDFVKLEKIDDHEHIAHGEGMPDILDRAYDYNPKPANPMPPISIHEFQKRFFSCSKSRKKTSLCNESSRTGGRCRVKGTALQRIPKRDREVEEGGDERDIYWGLQAKEELQALRVLLYHLIALIGPIVFWIIWMRSHPGDLQNAAVPVTVALCSLSMLLSFWMMQTKN